ncbi:LabA-like NYN domain-containing protein [Fodinicurvata fenggangensis]|uniref:LabA-like NYN domain-containing protein n=1 Tax=Fodinicurvata fenggangensis TaxID=1121830 RepID=UPI0004789AC1|nr:NYN domain-containing protein [Fodinicurvata fenggangensis]
MNFYPEEKIALFIDGSNLYSTARSLNFDIDYKKLYQVFADEARLVRAFYYTALVEDQEYSPLRPLIDWLDYNGYTMVTKPAKEYTDGNGRRKVKGNMDIELAVDMMELSDKIDHAVLFSGDGDFRSLIAAVQRRGVRVTVISSIRAQPSMIADELRRQADHFIDINSLRGSIARSGPPVEKSRRQDESRDEMEEDEDELDAEFLNDDDAYEEEYASD